MLDLHCHILPGVDDGPSALDEALEMARFCVDDGITHITATPHCNRSLRLLRAEILPHVERFNEELRRAAVPLTVLPGSEIQLTTTAQYRRDFESGVYCHLGDGKDFTLLEYSWRGDEYQADTPDLIVWLCDHGMTPILAHPERHRFLREYPERLRSAVDAGAWLQITVDSLLGNHGVAPEAAAWELMATYPGVIVLSTDAHNLQRCSGLSAGYRAVAERMRTGVALQLRERSDQILMRLLTSA
jgi:protein-tyrosine phosphatase